MVLIEFCYLTRLEADDRASSRPAAAPIPRLSWLS